MHIVFTPPGDVLHLDVPVKDVLHSVNCTAVWQLIFVESIMHCYQKRHAALKDCTAVWQLISQWHNNQSFGYEPWLIGLQKRMRFPNSALVKSKSAQHDESL
jgi:hypothetical protein